MEAGQINKNIFFSFNKTSGSVILNNRFRLLLSGSVVENNRS